MLCYKITPTFSRVRNSTTDVHTRVRIATNPSLVCMQGPKRGSDGDWRSGRGRQNLPAGNWALKGHTLPGTIFHPVVKLLKNSGESILADLPYMLVIDNR